MANVSKHLKNLNGDRVYPKSIMSEIYKDSNEEETLEDVLSDLGGDKTKIFSTKTSVKPKIKYFVPKTWSGLISFNGANIWTDGSNIYYSSSTDQYVLDKSTSTWSAKTWSGLTDFYGNGVWTDGSDIYYSNGFSDGNYVLDKSTSTWSAKTWNGYNKLRRSYIWTDGSNIYYSYESDQYILDKSTSTWSAKTWSGLTDFYGANIWTDGSNIYYSDQSYQYILDKSTSTWSAKTWSGLTNFDGMCIWTDGSDIYYSDASNQYVLDKSTSTWSAKTWSGLTNFVGMRIWTDGSNIYYSDQSNQYAFTSKYEDNDMVSARDINQINSQLSSYTTVASVAGGTKTWSQALAILYTGFQGLSNAQKLRSAVIYGNTVFQPLDIGLGYYTCAYAFDTDITLDTIILSTSKRYVGTRASTSDKSSSSAGANLVLVFIP